MEQIKTYYNALAPNYDKSRFGTSYGKFIHAQEHRLLSKILSKFLQKPVLDLACGTGRMLDFAQTGCDFSPKMLAEAQIKHPSKTLVLADASLLPFAEGAFAAVFSLHFFMHLEKERILDIMAEVQRVLRSDGLFIFDFPSEKRRRLTRGHQTANWHGSNALSLEWVSGFSKDNGWEIVEYQGILFFPIHRIPVFMRPFFLAFDSFLCRSFLKEYASYLIVCLQKK